MKDIFKPSPSILIGNEGVKDNMVYNNILFIDGTKRTKTFSQAYFTKKPSLLHFRYIEEVKDIFKPSSSFTILHQDNSWLQG